MPLYSFSALKGAVEPTNHLSPLSPLWLSFDLQYSVEAYAIYFTSASPNSPYMLY